MIPMKAIFNSQNRFQITVSDDGHVSLVKDNMILMGPRHFDKNATPERISFLLDDAGSFTLTGEELNSLCAYINTFSERNEPERNDSDQSYSWHGIRLD